MSKYLKTIRNLLIAVMLVSVSGAFLQAGAQDNNSNINVNTASVEELTDLKGIGPVIAKRIVNYRQENGSFADAGHLRKVKGLGSKTIADIEHRLSFESASD